MRPHKGNNDMRVWGRGNLYCKQVWKMAARRKGACIWQHSPGCSLALPLILKPPLHSQPQKCNGSRLHSLLTLFPLPIPAVLLEEGAGFPPAASHSETASSFAATRNFASTGCRRGTEAGDQRLICARQASWRGFSCEQGRVSPTGGEEVLLLLHRSSQGEESS